MKKGEAVFNIIILLLIALVAGAILWNIWGPAPEEAAAGSGRPGGPGGPGRPGGGPGGGADGGTAVVVSPVTLGTVQTGVRTHGELLPREQVSVIAPVAGRIATAPPVVGTVVRSGQSIAVIDPSRPGETFSLSTVTSPVTGTITAVQVAAGDTVTAQSTLLTIANLDTLEIHSGVPERFAGVIREGISGTITLEAFPGETFAARVTRLAPQLDRSSRTLPVVLELETPDPRIRPGMFASLELITERREGVVTAPRSAVLEGRGEQFVYVVQSGNVAQRRTVTLGLERDGIVEIRSGLAAGDQLVTRGQSFLTDGATVRITGERI
jgi:multidrug efflux pump subunit AcrA (membrane-fusion protein)